MFYQTYYSLFSDEVWQSWSNIRWLPASLDFILWKLKHNHICHTSRLKNIFYWTWPLPKRININLHYSWHPLDLMLNVKAVKSSNAANIKSVGHQESQRWRTNQPCFFINEWFAELALELISSEMYPYFQGLLSAQLVLPGIPKKALCHCQSDKLSSAKSSRVSRWPLPNDQHTIRVCCAGDSCHSLLSEGLIRTSASTGQHLKLPALPNSSRAITMTKPSSTLW